MLNKLLNSTIYVRVTQNQFRLRHIEDNREITVSAIESFTTKRLLIGEFTTAEKYLKQGFDMIHQGKWLPASPVVVIQPLEMIDEGLSQIEERVLREVAAGAGARKVVVWVGQELSDQEVISRAKGV